MDKISNFLVETVNDEQKKIIIEILLTKGFNIYGFGSTYELIRKCHANNWNFVGYHSNYGICVFSAQVVGMKKISFQSFYREYGQLTLDLE